MGLETHPKKRQRGVDESCVWGVQIEGRAALLGAPRHKISAMMVLLLTLACYGVASAETIDMLTGQAAYICCFRRPLMAVLNFLYKQAEEGGSRSKPFLMHPWARNELAVLGLLLPLSISNLRVPYAPSLFGSDASLEAAGGISLPVAAAAVGEIWRRIPMRLRGQRLLDPVSADLRISGLDEGGDSDDSHGDEIVHENVAVVSAVERAQDFWASTD